jgi:hypothetical protein
MINYQYENEIEPASFCDDFLETLETFLEKFEEEEGEELLKTDESHQINDNKTQIESNLFKLNMSFLDEFNTDSFINNDNNPPPPPPPIDFNFFQNQMEIF